MEKSKTNFWSLMILRMVKYFWEKAVKIHPISKGLATPTIHPQLEQTLAMTKTQFSSPRKGQVLYSQHFEAVTELTSKKSLRKRRRLKANANCHSDMLRIQVALASFKRLLKTIFWS